MSIFQESFRPYVDRQLKIREAILQHGNSNNRFNSPTNPVNKKNKIDQGAFFVNTVKRQCTIKMSSGVNINESSETAKQWVLRGGVLPETKERRIQQGFVHDGQKYTAYGSPGTFSDADDGYGIVPMPGITDANIRTKSAYGSLREAQINFICHNRRQLGILEKLYMRPGFPILVEWQWTPYVNNKGKIVNTSYTYPSFWKKGITFDKLQNSILETKARTGGNYDAFIGLCKNFSFKATPAGGYECTTEIISTGEVIDGLKGRRDGYELVEESGTRTLDNFEYYLEAIKQYGGNDPLKDKNPALIPVMQKLAEASPNDVDDDKYGGVVLYTADDLVEFIGQQKDRQQYRENNGVFDGSAWDIVESILYSKVSTSGFHKGHTTTDQKKLEQWQKERAKNNMAYSMEMDRIEEYLNHFIIRKGEFPSIEGPDPGFNMGSPHTYIRWDFLAHIMNTYVLETYQEKQPITEINWGNLVKSNNEETFKYYDYVTTKGKLETIIPRSFDGGKGKEFMPLSSILDISLDGGICILPHQINTLMLGNTTATGANSSTPMADIQTFSKSCIAKLSHPTEATEHSIGMIFLNVDNLLKKYASLRYTSDGTLNKNFNILAFLKQIWETDVNSACAHTHNFMVHHDKDNTQIIRIIDVQSQNGLHPDDLYTFKIQDNNSIVRDFNFNSTIPSSLVATMAIVAQDPRSIGGIESVTCNSLNKGLSSRFSKYTVPDVSNFDIREERATKEQELADGAVKLFNYNYTMLTGHTWTGMLTVATVRDATNLYKKTQDSVEFLQCRYPLRNEKKEDFEIDKILKGGCIRTNINANKSAIIPLKFTCLLDGIGGILIGNVFKVDKSRLPIGYQNDDVAFIVHSESQTITTGQDWTTEIAGQLILLDMPQKTEEMEGVLISPGKEFSGYKIFTEIVGKVSDLIDQIFGVADAAKCDPLKSDVKNFQNSKNGAPKKGDKCYFKGIKNGYNNALVSLPYGNKNLNPQLLSISSRIIHNKLKYSNGTKPIWSVVKGEEKYPTQMVHHSNPSVKFQLMDGSWGNTSHMNNNSGHNMGDAFDIRTLVPDPKGTKDNKGKTKMIADKNRAIDLLHIITQNWGADIIKELTDSGFYTLEVGKGQAKSNFGLPPLRSLPESFSYIISNGAIWSASKAEKGWRKYSGNAHDKHMHLEVYPDLVAPRLGCNIGGPFIYQ